MDGAAGYTWILASCIVRHVFAIFYFYQSCSKNSREQNVVFRYYCFACYLLPINEITQEYDVMYTFPIIMHIHADFLLYTLPNISKGKSLPFPYRQTSIFIAVLSSLCIYFIERPQILCYISHRLVNKE